MKLFKLLPTIAATALAASLSVVANALPIDGTISFAGADWSKDGQTLVINDESVTAATGDLAGELNSTTVEIFDLDYSPFAPLDPLWVTDNFQFAITSLTVDFETAGPNGALFLSGKGTLSGTGFDDTSGDWTFSGGNLNWSSATVPEPSAAALLGLGLVGLAIGRRRARK